MKHTLILASIMILLVAGGAAATPSMQLLVPAYFYPTLGPYWDMLAAAAPSVPLTAILDPASGPGTFIDPNYVTAVNNLRTAGGKVLGYITSSYATRTLSAMTAEVETYASFYGVDGIFVDEMANDTLSAHVQLYASLYNYIKAQHPGYEVVGNPGTTSQEIYLSTPTVDALVTYENGTGYPGYVPDPWTAGYSADHFAHIPYRVATADTMRAYVHLAHARNVGRIFVTDADLPNPYDRLPAYWAEEVACVESLAVAGAGAPPRTPASGLALRVCPSIARGACEISWQDLSGERVEVWISDIQGRVIQQLARAGGDGIEHCLWAGDDGHGRPVADGVYWVVVRGQMESTAQRVIRLAK